MPPLLLRVATGKEGMGLPPAASAAANSLPPPTATAAAAVGEAEDVDEHVSGCRDEALSNQRWRDLHKVYMMYEAVCAAAPAEGPGCIPRALLRAHLFFGLSAVMVYMPFQSGKEVLYADLCGGPLLQQLAEAIAWLAWRSILYYGVRTPNVIVSGHGASALAVFVDYDDLVIVEPHSINTFDEYIEVLKSTMGRRGEVDVSSCLLAWPALCNLVDVELRKTH